MHKVGKWEMENGESELIRPQSVSWKLCNNFWSRSRGNYEEHKLLRSFIPCRLIVACVEEASKSNPLLVK